MDTAIDLSRFSERYIGKAAMPEHRPRCLDTVGKKGENSLIKIQYFNNGANTIYTAVKKRRRSASPARNQKY